MYSTLGAVAILYMYLSAENDWLGAVCAARNMRWQVTDNVSLVQVSPHVLEGELTTKTLVLARPIIEIVGYDCRTCVRACYIILDRWLCRYVFARTSPNILRNTSVSVGSLY